MQLISEEKLIWSPVVANSRMNRERNASGVNSYEKEFGFKPQTFLETKIKESGNASWLDLCCGLGNAIIQTAAHFSKTDRQQYLKLIGIDLLDRFQSFDKSLTCITLVSKSVVGWIPEQKYDLITCSHGLHYLGDKLKVIETAIGALNPHGLFIAHLDLKNIVTGYSSSISFLCNQFKKEKIQYNKRTRLIQKTGGAEVNFGLQYTGADDKAGPNYTGQDAVNSYYMPKDNMQ